MQRAILDDDGVLRGFEAIEGKPPAGTVTVPDGCDLDTGGRYFWRHGAFWPIPRSQDERRHLLQNMMATYRAGRTDWSDEIVTWIYRTYGGSNGST